MCRWVLALEPGDAEAMHLLGILAHQRGANEEAIEWIGGAIREIPGEPVYHSNLGEVLRAAGRFEEAISAYHRALGLAPALPEVHNNLGNALSAQGDLAGAEAAYRRAIELKADYAGALANLGSVLSDQGRHAEAVIACRRALKSQPHFPPAGNNLGVALIALGQPAEAVAVLRRVIELHPQMAAAHKNLGDALVELGAFAGADAAFARALELNPANANARFSQGLLALLLGNFERGWPLYEARRDVFRQSRRGFSQPMWEGEPLAHRRILVHAEQGFGDAIQFVRYVRLLAAKCDGEVIVECQRELVSLFSRLNGVSAVVAYGDALPEFDVHAPMLSLPWLFQTTAESIPAEVPYLFPDPQRVADWAGRLGERSSSRLRVGMVWASNPENRQARKRDIALRQLEPLWKLDGVDFFSLQMGSSAARTSAAHLTDHTGQLQDFADTAAFLVQLDLIISVDTATPHLAGALGLPVWTLLAQVPDWRWGVTGEKTAWYPTMRLFRQPSPGDWESVIRQVAQELAATVSSRRVGL